MSVTRNYARHLRVITVLQTITLQLRIVTRKVRNYAVITHFTHLQRNAAIVTRNPRTLAMPSWVHERPIQHTAVPSCTCTCHWEH